MICDAYDKKIGKPENGEVVENGENVGQSSEEVYLRIMLFCLFSWYKIFAIVVESFWYGHQSVKKLLSANRIST